MKVIITELNSRFYLRTEYGNPVGPRMLGPAAPEGVAMPAIPPADGYGLKMDAHRDAMNWNLYLRAVRDIRLKRTTKPRKERNDEYYR